MDRKLFLRMLLERSQDTQSFIKEKAFNRNLTEAINTPVTLKRMQILKMGQCKIKAPQPQSPNKIIDPHRNYQKNRSITVSLQKRNNKQLEMNTLTSKHSNKYYTTQKPQSFNLSQSNNLTFYNKDSPNDPQQHNNFIEGIKYHGDNYRKSIMVLSNEQQINYTLSTDFMEKKSMRSSQVPKSNLIPNKYHSRAITFNSTRKIYNKQYDHNNLSTIIRKKHNLQVDDETTNKIFNRKHNSKNYAKQFIQPPKITAKSYIVVEIGNTPLKVHLSNQSKSMFEIASLTKIMTCFLTIQFCKKYDINMTSEIVNIGRFQSNIGGTSAKLCKGQIYTLDQLLYGLMLPSGNDASLAISVHIGRLLMLVDQYRRENQKSYTIKQYININSESFFKKTKKMYYLRFVQQMNSKARQLDMKKTSYANPHGLVNPLNKSCCYDISVLCENAMKCDKFREIVSTKNYKSQIKYIESINQRQISIKKTIVKKKVSRKPSKQKLDDQYYSESQEQNYEGEEDLTDETMSTNLPNSFTNFKIKPIQWQNTHKLLCYKSNQYIGIKTGVTMAAGPCLASCVISPNQRKFLIVLLDCKKMSHRFKQTEILKKWIYSKQGITINKGNDQQYNNKQSEVCNSIQLVQKCS